MTLTTFGPGIWNDLPVLVKGLALRKSGNDYGNKGDHKKPSDELETNLIRSFPELTSETLEEFGHCEFGNP